MSAWAVERWASAAMIVASALGAPHAQSAENSARDWLQRMAVAHERQNYEGVLAYLGGGALSNIRVAHAFDGVREYERLAQLEGPRREVVRNGDRVDYLFDPEDSLALAVEVPTGAMVETFTRDFSSLPASYDAVIGDRTRVADREVVTIDIVPRDAWRFGYRLCLDVETGLLLKSELLDAAGLALETLVFSTIEIGKKPDAALFKAPSAGRRAQQLHLAPADASRTAAATDAAATSPWRLGWLPAGFSVSASDRRRSAGGATDVVTLMYTDGLTSFSVFIEPMPDGVAPHHVTRQGATVAVAGALPGPGKAAYVATVVGEIPNTTAESVLGGIEFVGK